MKVTTELKNLIKDEFSNKREKIRQDVLDFQKTKYEEAILDIENSKAFKTLKDAASKLYEEYSGKYITEKNKYDNSTENDICYVTSMLLNLKELTGKKLFGDNSYYYNKLNICQDKITELNKQEQSLLIKLTYEKDIEVIKSMLAEYGINIL